MSKPAEYIVTEKSFLDNRLCEEGDVVVLDIDYSPKTNPNLKPVNPPKPKKAKDEADTVAGDAGAETAEGGAAPSDLA